MKSYRDDREISQQILQYMESKICSNPPQPFHLAGTLMKDLQLSKSDFYIGIGLLLGYRVQEYREGKKRYFYLSEMVEYYKLKIKKMNKKGELPTFIPFK